MSDIVIFDPQTNKVNSHLTSQNSAQFQGRQDVVIYQDGTTQGDASILSIRNLFNTVPIKYLTQDNGTIREMTAAEKTKVDLFLGPAGKVPYGIKTLLFENIVNKNPQIILDRIKKGIFFIFFIEGNSGYENLKRGQSALVDPVNFILSKDGSFSLYSTDQKLHDIYLNIIYS